MPYLLHLPNELIITIAEVIAALADLNAFSQSSWRITNLVTRVLYRRDAKRALLWGAEKGRVNTVNNALRAKANINEPYVIEIGSPCNTGRKQDALVDNGRCVEACGASHRFCWPHTTVTQT